MAIQNKKWHTAWWMTTLIFPVIGAVLASFIYDAVKSYPLLTTCILIVKKLFKLLVVVITFKIAIWVIALFLAIAFFGLYSYTRIKYNVNNPTWLEFKSERFKNWQWVWSYQFNKRTKKFDIINLQPICGRCSVKMLESNDILENRYVCPQCETVHGTRSGNYYEHKDLIRSLVIDRIEKQYS